MSDKTKACCIPGCAEQGIIKVEDDKWMCTKHIIERVHSPENMALTQADEDMQTFRDEGGKLS